MTTRPALDSATDYQILHLGAIAHLVNQKTGIALCTVSAVKHWSAPAYQPAPISCIRCFLRAQKEMK